MQNMSTVKHISTLEFDFTGIKQYEWTFNLHTRSVLMNNLALGPTKMYEFNDMKFTTGALAQLDHFWELKILSSMLIVVRIWVKKRPDIRFKIYPSKICLLSKEKVLSEASLGMTAVPESIIKDHYMGMAALDLSNVYKKPLDSIRIILDFQCEPSPRYIHSLTSYCEDANRVAIETAQSQRLNAKEFLLNRSMSDVTLHCGGVKFHAHRVILACQSPVFQKMFENEMKESNAGIVEIKDVEPNVLKELLNFIYTDELTTEEIADEMCQELFKLTERYGVQPLKVKCAQIILKNISVKNAMEVYMLGDMYNENMLKIVAMDLIKRDRVKAMQDPKTFKEFTIRYPEIAFDLLKH